MELALSVKLNRKKAAQPQVEQRSTVLSNPAEWLLNFFRGVDTNGVPSTGEGALRLSAVYSCIRLISETFGGMSVELIQKTDQGRKVITNHRGLNLIRRRPSPSMSAMVFKETLQGQVLANGNGIARIIRNASGEAEELVYYQTGNVSVAEVDRKLYYRFNDINDPVPYYDVIHIQAFGVNGCMGISPIRQHAMTIEAGLNAQAFNTNFYKNGGWVKGILKFTGNLKPGRSKELGDEWDNNYGGPDQAYKTPVLHSGTEFNPVNINQRDAQYIESMKFTRSEIAAIFNVPSSMIGDTEGANFSVMEQQDIRFVKYTLNPWLKKWEQELDFKLLSDKERSEGYQFKFNVNSLLRGDIKTRSEYYRTMLSHGVYSPNDVRELENKNPREGGDSYFTQVNTQTQKQTSLQEEKLAAEIEKINSEGNA